MTRSTRFLRGVGVSYMTQLVVTVVGLWLTPFLLRKLGQHDYGLWLVGTQLLGYLGLLDIGIVAMLPRETAFARTRDLEGDTGGTELHSYVGRAARVSLWQLAAMTLVAGITWLVLPREWHELRGPLALIFVVFAVTFPMRVLHGVLLGLQDLSYVGMVALAQWGSTTIVMVGLLLAGFGLPAMAVGWSFGQLLAAALWAWRFRTTFPGVLPPRIPSVPWREARQLLGRGTWFSISQISSALLGSTDLLVIGKILGPVAVVPYSITGKLVGVLSNQPQLLMASAVPALSELSERREMDRLMRALAALGQLMLLASGLVTCVVLAVNHGFVAWWVSPAQYGGDVLTMLILASMLVRHFNLMMMYALHSYGRYDRRGSLTSLADGLVTVAAGAVLVRFLGPIGAPIGALVGVCCVSLPLNVVAMAREHEVSPAGLARHYVPVLGRIVFLAALIVGVLRFWHPSGLLQLMAAGATTVAMYLLVMSPLLRTPPVSTYLVPRLGRFGALLRARAA